MAFEIKRNDQRPRYRVQLTSNGDPADLTDASSVKFLMKQGAGTLKITAAATFVDKPTGVVEYAWVVGDTDTAGTYNVEFEITWPGGEKQTFPSSGYFVCTINDDLG